MVELEEVTKAYGGQTVVDRLSLRIREGTVFGFLGQNGAGKTTTIKMMVGISRPDQGSVRIAGGAARETATKKKIGFMPEAPYFYDRLTGLEFLLFCSELFGADGGEASRSRCEKILRDVGIAHAANRPVGTYSKGMKQRLGFGQALVNDPPYVFLDEPLDGLDPIGRREIKGIIKKLKGEGKTIFFNSHILFDTEELCDEIGILHEGKLLYAGPVEEFCKGSASLEERFVEVVEAHRASC